MCHTATVHCISFLFALTFGMLGTNILGMPRVNIWMLFAADSHVKCLESFDAQRILPQGVCNILQCAMLVHVHKVCVTVEVRVPVVLVFNCSCQSVGATAEPSDADHAAPKHVLARIGFEVPVLALVVVTVRAERTHSHSENKWQHPKYPDTKSFDPTESVSSLPLLPQVVLRKIYVNCVVACVASKQRGVVTKVPSLIQQRHATRSYYGCSVICLFCCSCEWSWFVSKFCGKRPKTERNKPKS